MRDFITTLAELAGAAAVTAGAALVYVPAGFVTGGLLLIGLGYAAGRDPEVKP